MTVHIEEIERWVFRAPIARPVANAFGAMSNRPALFVRLTASDGVCGWGEVFCNFPQVGAEHRARLIDSVFVPLLEGACADGAAEVRALLATRTRQMAIQCGEPGPFAQISGAVDQALWDMAARRAGLPLWRYLGGSQSRVQVYASGIGPDDVVSVALAKHAQGFRAFKLKVGFGTQRDVANLAALREALGGQVMLMCDANQAWSPHEAPQRIAELTPFNLLWIEEPIAADESVEVWKTLAKSVSLPIAAGENIRGLAAFEEALDAGYLRYVQPDVGKWGGISGGLEVARLGGKLGSKSGAAYCPHWLAGGVGLAASMHALAASGHATGMAEVDANPNPLREDVFPFEVREGWVTLPEAPGLGFEPDLDRLASYRVSE